MTDGAVIWHYGLMAERWAEFVTDAPEVTYLLQAIARYGQPVLDLACGTGRVLLPLLRAGVDIDGCDISKDMLQYCRSKAAREGLSANLYADPMDAFELPRTYKTIYMCGSFGLAGSREKDLETLRHCYAHLDDGGAFVLDIQAEYTSASSWNLWLAEYRHAMPQPWPEKGDGRIAGDGSEHFAQFRMVNVDPLEQTYTRQVRLEKWSGGGLVAAEEHTLCGSMYFKHEVLLMLKVVGFNAISVHGGYTDEPPTADHEDLVFTAIR